MGNDELELLAHLIEMIGGPSSVCSEARRMAPVMAERFRFLQPTDAAMHGARQLSFFNTHYDNHCYLPMLGFVSFDDEPDQYLCAAVLRPGNVGAATNAVGVLRRLITLVQDRTCLRRYALRRQELEASTACNLQGRGGSMKRSIASAAMSRTE